MRKIILFFVSTAILWSMVGVPTVRAALTKEQISTGQVYSCTCGDVCLDYALPDPVPSDKTTLCASGCTLKEGAVCPNTRAGACRGSECVKLENPLNLKDKEISVPTILGNVIKGMLSIIGSLALLMIVWGGFQWLTSMGNPEKVKAGGKTMIWAAVGLFLVFASYLLVSNVLNLIKPQVATTTSQNK